jgi:transcriptional regulator with XRE-family HTH domain
MKLMTAIRQAIAKSGKTQYRISKDLHWNESYLSQVMRGKTSFSVERLDALADYLDLEIVLRKKGKATRGKRSK